jgi:hypothetical protein
MNDALPTELFSSAQKSIRLLASKQQTDAFYYEYSRGQ